MRIKEPGGLLWEWQQLHWERRECSAILPAQPHGLTTMSVDQLPCFSQLPVHCPHWRLWFNKEMMAGRCYWVAARRGAAAKEGSADWPKTV